MERPKSPPKERSPALTYVRCGDQPSAEFLGTPYPESSDRVRLPVRVRLLPFLDRPRPLQLGGASRLSLAVAFSAPWCARWLASARRRLTVSARFGACGGYQFDTRICCFGGSFCSSRRRRLALARLLYAGRLSADKFGKFMKWLASRHGRQRGSDLLFHQAQSVHPGFDHWRLGGLQQQPVAGDVDPGFRICHHDLGHHLADTASQSLGVSVIGADLHL